MRYALVFAVLLLGYATPASAFRTVAEYEQVKAQPEFAQFLFGVAEGFMLSQAIYKKNNRGVIYCPPEKLQFSQLDYVSLVDREVASGQQPPGKLISVVLIEVMINKFPCARPATPSPYGN